MTARRQFFQTFLIATAALALPPDSWAGGTARPPLPPAEPGPPEARSGIVLLEEDDFSPGLQIKIIGLGGAGCHAVDDMIASDLGNTVGVEFICADTDAPLLRRSRAHKTIWLGASGHSAADSADPGRQAAEHHEAEIRDAIGLADMVFVTAGMGGCTGTDAAPVFARIARDIGILTIGVVTLPCECEGHQRMKTASAGLAALQSNVDALMLLPNEKLRTGLPDAASQSGLFAGADKMLKTAIGGMVEIINLPGIVGNLFHDVRHIMAESGGRAMLGIALASGPDRGRLAAEAAVACPMLEGVNLMEAKGVLLTIRAARGKLKLSESKLVLNTIRAKLSPEAHLLYGTTFDDSLNDDLRVTVVVTGLMVAGGLEG